MTDADDAADSSPHNMTSLLDVFKRDPSQTFCSVRLPHGETQIVCRSPERGVTTLVYIQPRDQCDTTRTAVSMVNTMQEIRDAVAAGNPGESGSVAALQPSRYYYMLTQPSTEVSCGYTDQGLMVMIDEGMQGYHHSRCTGPFCPGYDSAQQVESLERDLGTPCYEWEEWTCSPLEVQLDERWRPDSLDTANPFYHFFAELQDEAERQGTYWPPGPRDQWNAQPEGGTKTAHKHKHTQPQEAANSSDQFGTISKHRSSQSEFKSKRRRRGAHASRWVLWPVDTHLIADRRNAPAPLSGGVPVTPSNCADRYHHRLCRSVLCPGSATKAEAAERAVRPRTPPPPSRQQSCDSERTVWGDESDNARWSGSDGDTAKKEKKSKRGRGRRPRDTKSRDTLFTETEGEDPSRLKDRRADSRGWGSRCRPDLAFPWLTHDDALDPVGAFRALPSAVMREALSHRPTAGSRPPSPGGSLEGEGAGEREGGFGPPLRLPRWFGDDGVDPATLAELTRRLERGGVNVKVVDSMSMGAQPPPLALETQTQTHLAVPHLPPVGVSPPKLPYFDEDDETRQSRMDTAMTDLTSPCADTPVIAWPMRVEY